MSQDWVQHIVQAKEDLRSGARSGTPENVERELRLESYGELLWPELLTALVAAVDAYNNLVHRDEELAMEGDNDDPWEGLIISRTGSVPARAEIRMIQGGAIQCEMTWRNAPQGRITATPQEPTPDSEGLFQVASSDAADAARQDVHPSALAEHLLTRFFRHI